MFDWRGVEEFAQVVEQGSFTKAARTLCLSKSYVSKTVNELEARLGVQLLFRSTRRLSLTGAGELFYTRCAEIRRLYGEAAREIGEFQNKPTGRLRIGLCDIFGVSFMSSVVAEFTQRFPDVVVEVVAYLRDEELSHQEFDVLVRYGRLPASELKIRRFGYLSYGLCASAAYVEEHGWPSGIDDLANHQCLTGLDGTFAVTVPDGDQVRRIKVPTRWTSNSSVALVAAAKRHLGIAQIPISIAQEAIESGDIRVLEADWAFHDQEVWACFPPGILSAATRAFLDHVASRFEHVRLRPQTLSRLNSIR